MKLNVLIEKLKAAHGPDRGLDGHIALAVGFRKRHDVINDQKTGAPVKRTVWLAPRADKFVPVPYYTRSLDDARELSQSMSNGETAGVSWEGSKFFARIKDGPVCTAATPAIALCVAALTHRMATEE